MSEHDRVAVFIDGSNLYHSLEENCRRADLDFEGFVYRLLAGRTLYRTYYYNILQDAERQQGASEQQKFLASLYKIPRFEVRLGTTKYRGDQLVEKGVDIMLATDLLHYAWEDLYDVAIVVSGDGDFAYAVKTVKNMGKHVEIAAFPVNLSTEMAQIADDRHFFDQEFFKDLWVSGHKQATAGGGGPVAGGAPRRRRRRGGRGRFGGSEAGATQQPPAGDSPRQGQHPSPPGPSSPTSSGF
ncbi:MAG: NYN domain-containing protein [Chloroflexi bacterium]|nr:NYN domain-containing protein [Chloroflexota bacterium]